MTVISKVHPYNIHGFTALGFELVKEKFIENFETKMNLVLRFAFTTKEKKLSIYGVVLRIK
ncbi:MAG: hypothetical protein IPO64_07050 [Bacteroidetes bacterium]|nr:hypothetical protein [Bacteroidota bacterium]